MNPFEWLVEMAQRSYEATQPGRDDRNAAGAAGVDALTAAMQATDAFFANANRASWDGTLGVEDRGYDPNLRQADNNRERGMPDILAETLGFVSEMGNPFPLDFVGDALKVAGGVGTAAAMVPREILEAFSKVTKAGSDGLPPKVYHGTSTPVDTRILRPSETGAHGRGFYVTEDLNLAEEFSNMPFSENAIDIPSGSYPSIREGYYGTSDIVPAKPTSRRWDNFENADEAVAWHSGGVGVMHNPSTDWIESWNAPRMMEVIQESGQFSPEELENLMRLVNDFTQGR